MKDWKKEDDETEKTAGGKVPETKDECMDAVEKRKGFWMDWRQMKAVAATSWNGLGITVLVYEWTAGEWKLRGRIKAKGGEKQIIAPCASWGQEITDTASLQCQDQGWIVSIRTH